MAFLDKNILECISAKVTDLGRRRISEGKFDILYFKAGDSEYDYNYWMLDEQVMVPVEMDCDLKYPLIMDVATGLDYAPVVANHSSITVTENLDTKGIVSGTTMTCGIVCFNLNILGGQNYIELDTVTGFTNCSSIILSTQTAIGPNPTLTGNTASYFYTIVSVDTNTNRIYLDRPVPFYNGSPDIGFIACLDCSTTDLVNCEEVFTDPWKMNIPWTEKPAGLDSTSENLSGYGSNDYTSAKEYFGYTSSSGQTNNLSTTFTNSLGENIVVAPREQKTIAIVHYSGQHFDYYEDWLADDIDAQAYFEMYIPFLLYHRGGTIGQKFFMSSDYGYVTSTKNHSSCLGEKYHYLIDESGVRVGKIFVYKRVIVIDDQEIVAALSYKSNRTWTLPAPRVSYVPVDLPCDPDSGQTPLISGTTKDVWFSYFFENSGDPNKQGMHCNYYLKLAGSGTTTCANGSFNASLKFGNQFPFMNVAGGFDATKLWALVQIVDAGELPSPDNWTKVDLTSQIPNYTNPIDPSSLVGYQFIITFDMYDNGSLYVLSDYIGPQPLENGGQNELQFGDERIFPGSVRATRGTNIYEMNFLANLPATQFNISQNPTKLDAINARVTEVGLYNSNFELMVIGKAASPHERIGFQQFAIKIDF